MNEPRIKKPTSKAFHFPKSGKAETSPDEKNAAAPVTATVSAKASSEPNASRRKATARTEAAAKAAVAAKEKAAPKAKAATKPEATAKKKPAAKKVVAPKQNAVAPKKVTASAKQAAPASEAAQKPKRAKKEVVKKEKVVRDSFTMPKSDYAKIATLKQKCLGAGVSVKKSEVLRAGLLLLEATTLNDLLAAISAVETVKTGRPSKQ
jgi:hypothetical protein